MPMPDLYLQIAEQPDDVLEEIARGMDKRAAEPAMQRIAARYLGALGRRGVEVLEIGCGNGASTALLLQHLKPTRYVGIDPAAGLIERAQKTHRISAGVRFEVAHALATGQPDGAFDAVVAHTVFSHLADPEGALAESFRVIRPGGRLAVFDGDYATNTVALFDGDPLQTVMSMAQRNLIHDPYIMRRLAGLARQAGFTVRELEAHGYVQTEAPDYLLSLIARGASAAARSGECGADLAKALEAEAQQRVAEGTFYGAILFISLIAEKPRTG
jgi:SAM-dependent methyltransferase